MAGPAVPDYSVQRVKEDSNEKVKLVVQLPGIEAASDIQVRCGGCHIHVLVPQRYSLTVDLDCEVHDEAESVKFLRKKGKLKASFLVITAAAKLTTAAVGVPLAAGAEILQAEQQDLDLLQRLQQQAQQRELAQLERKAAAELWVSHGVAAVAAGDIAGAKAALLKASQLAVYPESDTRELMEALTQALQQQQQQQQQQQGHSSRACNDEQCQHHVQDSEKLAAGLAQSVTAGPLAGAGVVQATAAPAPVAANVGTTAVGTAVGVSDAVIGILFKRPSWFTCTWCQPVWDIVWMALVCFCLFAGAWGVCLAVVEPALGYLARLGVPVWGPVRALTTVVTSLWWLAKGICTINAIHFVVLWLLCMWCCMRRRKDQIHQLSRAMTRSYLAWLILLHLCRGGWRGVAATGLACCLDKVEAVKTPIKAFGYPKDALPFVSPQWALQLLYASSVVQMIEGLQSCLSYFAAPAADLFGSHFTEAVFTVTVTAESIGMPVTDWSFLLHTMVWQCLLLALAWDCI